MTKVNSRAIISPQCISFSMLRTRPPTIVRLSHRLFRPDFVISARLYQTAAVTNTKNGRYDPGITTSLSSDGSIYIMVAPSAPHNATKPNILGIHFII